MCGIGGIMQRSAQPLFGQDLAEMSRLVAHRGPDAVGYRIFGENGRSHSNTAEPGKWTVGLIHRRLAIVDLSSDGQQPMSDESARYWIVFNGEIYNHIELRSELAAQGYRFQSHSDTEVVLAAYSRWGRDCLQRFNGMWAFAIYDCRAKNLFLARDRFGVKPLYYFSEPGRFAFASELKQLHQLQGGKGRVNRRLLADFFMWRLETHTQETFFEEMFCLPPGAWAEVDAETLLAGNIRPQQFWFPKALAHGNPANIHADFRALFEDAVRLRLRSDVPVGITLSGGLDSSAVACVASGQQKRDGAGAMEAFTAAYHDPGFSEEPFARSVAQNAGLKHTLIYPESGQITEDWNRFLWFMEEPFGSLSYYTNWKVYQQIRAAGISVILSGQGGDELLLGYERYRFPFLLQQMKNGRFPEAFKFFLQGRHRGNMGILRQLQFMAYFTMPELRALRRRRLVGQFLRKDFLEFGLTRKPVLMDSANCQNRIEMQIKEFSKYQLPHLLRHEDRVSMSHAVETRLPFLDYRLFEFVLGQRDEDLLAEGWSKHLLREAMRDILPEPVRLRTDKKGFDTPSRRLLREHPEFFGALLDRNHDDAALDTAAIRRAYNAGTIDAGLLCSACAYLSWKEIFQMQN